MVAEATTPAFVTQTFAVPSVIPDTSTSKYTLFESDTVLVPEGCEVRSAEKMETGVPSVAEEPDIVVETPVVAV